MPDPSAMCVVDQALELAKGIDWEGAAVHGRLHKDVAAPVLDDHLADIFVDLKVG